MRHRSDGTTASRAVERDVLAAYRAGLTIGEVAAIFGLPPSQIAQLIVVTGTARRRRQRVLRAVEAPAS